MGLRKRRNCSCTCLHCSTSCRYRRYRHPWHSRSRIRNGTGSCWPPNDGTGPWGRPPGGRGRIPSSVPCPRRRRRRGRRRSGWLGAGEGTRWTWRRDGGMRWRRSWRRQPPARPSRRIGGARRASPRAAGGRRWGRTRRSRPRWRWRRAGEGRHPQGSLRTRPGWRGPVHRRPWRRPGRTCRSRSWRSWWRRRSSRAPSRRCPGSRGPTPRGTPGS
mmetsp:Transcript_18092/g.51456  ORF Transcript_18092/g.51456 Transcript_18092/m.51456 type:complete len:216 (+) Transcript_18092:1468-2115(+)